MATAASDRERFAVVGATGQGAAFAVGDAVRIGTRSPIGHYRVPTYLRGKQGIIETILLPIAIDNEEEGFGRDAGMKRHYYRVAIRMIDLWNDHAESPRDKLLIEIFETWLEAATP